MLSYAWGTKADDVFPNQERVLMLRDMLRAMGFLVWMDREWMMGNMDEVMVSAALIPFAPAPCWGSCRQRPPHGTLLPYLRK